jgi:tetratricopeptide (TPR) repeat protein
MNMTECTAQLRIFISYNQADRVACDQLVAALRGAGADVWYSEHSTVAGQAREESKRELHERPVCIVILSKAALASGWVQDDCHWAFYTSEGVPAMLLLPVVVGAFASEDLYGALYLGRLKRVESSRYQPYPVAEMIQRTLALLALTLQGETPAPLTPQPGQPVDDILIQGKALAARKLFGESLPFFERATQMARSSFDAWLALGYTLNQMERHDEALSALEHAIDIHPRSSAAWRYKGQALIGMKRSSDGLEALQYGFSLEQGDTAWSGSDFFTLDLRVFDEASPVETDPMTAGSWYSRGYALLTAEFYLEALEAFDQALELDPNEYGAWTNKGLALAGLHRYEEATSAYDQALALNPSVPQAWYNKGNALFELKRWGDALTAYDQVLALDPSDSYTRTFRGLTLNALERWEDALAEFNLALAVTPSHTLAWRGKAEALRRLERVAEAEAAEQRARMLGG